MAIILYNNKILLHGGKIAIDLDCCCGNPSPSPSPSPWPPDEEAWCPCDGDFLSPKGSVTLDNFTDDLDGSIPCGNLCFPPDYGGNIECSYSNLNGSYTTDVYRDGVLGWYGEAIVGTWASGWTYGDPIVDPGILVWKSTNCFDPYPVEYNYVWKIRCWYHWCEPCPSSNPEELWDLTRNRGLLSVEILMQYFGYGSPNHGGSSVYYGDCYAPCTHVARCNGGSCITEEGIEIGMSAGGGSMGSEAGDWLGLEDGNILGEQ